MQHISCTIVLPCSLHSEACYDHGVGNGTNWTCADAELIIQPSSEQSTSTEAVAWVQYNLSDIEWQPLTTAGARLSIGIGIRQAQMYISTNYCWYFDATFCYHFFRLQEVWGAEMAAFAIRLVSLVTFAMSCLYMALIFYRALRVSAPEARKLTVLAKKKATTKMYLFPAMRRKGAFDKNPGNGGSDDDSIHSESEVGVSSCARVSPPPSPPNDSNDPWSTPVTAASRSNGNRSTKSKKKAGLGWDLQRQSSYGAEPPPPSAEDDLWDGVDQCEALIEYVASMRTGPFFFCSFWLIFLPTFYTRIFLPCWDCHDYEARPPDLDYTTLPRLLPPPPLPTPSSLPFPDPLPPPPPSPNVSFLSLPSSPLSLPSRPLPDPSAHPN